MCKLNYPSHIRSMLKEPPIWNFFLCSAGSDTPQNNFEIWISPRIPTRIWKCFRVWIRGPYGVDSWKNQGPIISCYCTFKCVSKHHFSTSYSMSSLQRFPGSFYSNRYLKILYIISLQTIGHQSWRGQHWPPPGTSGVKLVPWRLIHLPVWSFLPMKVQTLGHMSGKTDCHQYMYYICLPWSIAAGGLPGPLTSFLSYTDLWQVEFLPGQKAHVSKCH